MRSIRRAFTLLGEPSIRKKERSKPSHNTTKFSEEHTVKRVSAGGSSSPFFREIDGERPTDHKQTRDGPFTFLFSIFIWRKQLH